MNLFSFTELLELHFFATSRAELAPSSVGGRKTLEGTSRMISFSLFICKRGGGAALRHGMATDLLVKRGPKWRGGAKGGGRSDAGSNHLCIKWAENRCCQFGRARGPHCSTSSRAGCCTPISIDGDNVKPTKRDQPKRQDTTATMCRASVAIKAAPSATPL